MDQNIQVIKAYLQKNKLNYGCQGLAAMTDMLYECYAQANPLQSEKMELALAELDISIGGLPLQENDRVVDQVSDLCMACEQAAFQAGMRVGLQLILELIGEGG